MMAAKAAVSRLLKTARGLKMIDDDRYCMDISNQILATDALLRKANCEVLSAHMKSCVKNAATEEEKDLKIDELVTLLMRLSK